MKFLLAFLFLITLSCTKVAKDKKVTVDEEAIVLNEKKEPKSAIIKSEEKQIESIYIGALKKIYEEDDYYVSLSFKDSLPESFFSEFHSNTDKYIGELISETENHQRFKIDHSIATQFFDTVGLNNLMVFDNHQQIIDTLRLKNYEFLSDQIGSEVIATYEKTSIVNKDIDYLCISKSDIDFKKNRSFNKDADYLKKVLLKNRLKYSSIHANYKLIESKDTIAIASFGLYKNDEQKESFYLFKNGKPIDSIINNYSIYKLMSVPIHLSSEKLYVSYEHIPDSDTFWVSLKGIDLENNKLKMYSGNRFIIK